MAVRKKRAAFTYDVGTDEIAIRYTLNSDEYPTHERHGHLRLVVADQSDSFRQAFGKVKARITNLIKQAEGL